MCSYNGTEDVVFGSRVASVVMLAILAELLLAPIAEATVEARAGPGAKYFYIYFLCQLPIIEAVEAVFFGNVAVTTTLKYLINTHQSELLFVNFSNTGHGSSFSLWEIGPENLARRHNSSL